MMLNKQHSTLMLRATSDIRWCGFEQLNRKG